MARSRRTGRHASSEVVICWSASVSLTTNQVCRRRSSELRGRWMRWRRFFSRSDTFRRRAGQTSSMSTDAVRAERHLSAGIGSVTAFDCHGRCGHCAERAIRLIDDAQARRRREPDLSAERAQFGAFAHGPWCLRIRSSTQRPGIAKRASSIDAPRGKLGDKTSAWTMTAPPGPSFQSSKVSG